MDQNKVPVRGDIHVLIVGMLNLFAILNGIKPSIRSLQN
jgi:hypothetical protein